MAKNEQQGLAKGSDGSGGLPVGLPTEANIPGIYKANPQRRNEVLSRGKMGRRIVTMVDGDVIEGVLIGEGSQLDVSTPDGDPGKVRTWNFDMGHGITVGILGSHQLDSELPAYIGRMLYVERVQSKAAGKRRVTEWCIVDLSPAADAS